jgi:single-stranded-DNA-specific exonuclease
MTLKNIISSTNRPWAIKDADFRRTEAFVQRYNIPEVVARVLSQRDIDLEKAADFLQPSLRAWMPDPEILTDMTKAATILAEAIEQNQPIALFGDYDVDGATSTALLSRFLQAVGVTPSIYIPDRFEEGYGPNSPAIETLASQGVRVIVFLDCGTTAFEPLARAQALGLRSIVIDHHTAEPKLPPAEAIVNPNRLEDTSGLGYLCAAGVAFMFAVAINRLLRQRRWYEHEARPEPDLRQWLDLVALGTVCDVVPMIGLNRAYVALGLKVLGQRQNLGIRALLDITKTAVRPTVYHLGYVIGPRINAGGRIAAADIGVRLLTTRDPIEAQTLAEQLHHFNQERRDIEAQVLAAALEAAEHHQNDAVIVVAGNDWHPGVIGIVAGRLKEKYHKPCCVISFDAQGDGKGSGRSVTGVHLGAAVQAAAQKGIILKGGGHEMAAGFSVTQNQLEAFRDFLNARLEAAARAYVPTVHIESYLSIRGITPTLVQAIEAIGPFGPKNPCPRFAVPYVQVVRTDVYQGQHIRAILRSEDGGTAKGMAFRAVDTPIGEMLLAPHRPMIHVAGTLSLDEWQGAPQVSLMIEDIASFADS